MSKRIIKGATVTQIKPVSNTLSLPDFSPDLLALPHGLGEVQAYILGRMKYPSPAMAGIASIAAFSAFAMPFVTVKSYDGRGLNEYFMVLAPTGFGKEDLRRSIQALYAELSKADCEGGNLAHLAMTTLQYSAPASPQALHKILEAQNAQFFMSDEFADWLAQSKNNSHNQATIAYFMELYTSALGTVSVPQSMSGQYVPVANPRVSIFATTTAERMSEVMTKSHADSGAYNRMVIFAAEQKRIPKRYEGLQYEPTAEVLAPFLWVMSQSHKQVTFTAEAWHYFKSHDSAVMEPLKFADHALAGRLSEQAIKLAATIALSDKRHRIERQDLATAFAIRENLYHRSKALLDSFGSLSGEHPTVKALTQLRETFARHPDLPRSRLSSYSRAYASLSNREQQDVVRALQDEGTISPTQGTRGRLESLIFEAVA